jgi:hypothetical protein
MNHEQRSAQGVESYAGGEIQTRHGIVNKWLLGLYVVLFLWSIWYLIGPFEGWRPKLEFWGWGGLGAGLSSKGAEQGVAGLQVIGVIALAIAVVSVLGFFAWIVLLARRK